MCFLGMFGSFLHDFHDASCRDCSMTNLSLRGLLVSRRPSCVSLSRWHSDWPLLLPFERASRQARRSSGAPSSSNPRKRPYCRLYKTSPLMAVIYQWEGVRFKIVRSSSICLSSVGSSTTNPPSSTFAQSDPHITEFVFSICTEREEVWGGWASRSAATGALRDEIFKSDQQELQVDPSED